MYVLITYDVSTTSRNGRRRLRRVAKACLDCGQRVQQSVFECKLDRAQLVVLRAHLLAIIEPEEDNLRIYNLGRRWRRRVEHFGKGRPLDIEGPLIA